ncbi:TPA: hypothetical protein RPC80_004903, partial [Escherichia coli]|nr:hypothetical protein [Escherichia coli]
GMISLSPPTICNSAVPPGMAYSVGEPQGPAGVVIGKQRRPTECGI